MRERATRTFARIGEPFSVTPATLVKSRHELSGPRPQVAAARFRQPGRAGARGAGADATRWSSNRLHHAYLFTGTRGVGKTTLARILAKA